MSNINIAVYCNFSNYVLTIVCTKAFNVKVQYQLSGCQLRNWQCCVLPYRITETVKALIVVNNGYGCGYGKYRL